MKANLVDGSCLVNHFLEKTAEQAWDKVALVCEGERLTYGEIESRANKMARALRDYGIEPGDRVILCLPNSVELVVSIFAVLKAEAIFVPVNATTKPDKLLFLAQNSRAKAMVLPSGQLEVGGSMQERAPCLDFTILTGKKPEEIVGSSGRQLFFQDIQEEYSGVRQQCNLTGRELACLIYTSGSTGEPKGVMSGHDNMVFASGSIISYLENESRDIVMNVLPLSFDYGLYQLLMTFRFGGTLVLEKSFAFPAKALKLMDSETVTGFPGVPTIFSILLKMDLSPYDLSSLRYISNTAAALAPGHIKAIQDKFPGASLFSMYGLTETKRTLYLCPDQLSRRPGSVGRPIPGTEAWLEDGTGRRLGPGEEGELVIRGPHVMRGYWDNPEATAARFQDGSGPEDRICYSGDLFRMDEEGYFYFVGRKDDIIKSRGEKVAPQEVESVLYEIPDVVEAAVVGEPDPILGQAVKAYLVLKPGSALTARDFLRHCRSNLEDFMVPQKVEFRETLPKSASGKIMKTALALT